MPLQAAGTSISFSQIRAEFGASGQVSMGQFYRGGFVPNDAFCHNNTVPGGAAVAGNPISFAGFYSTTRGNTYIPFYSTQNFSLVTNTQRIQMWIQGGGGGGANGGYWVNFPNFPVSCGAAGGGGGGYRFTQLNVNAATQYLYIVVGSGGGAANTEAFGDAIAGGGGTSQVNVIQGSTTVATRQAGGGGGGIWKSWINWGSTAGAGGGGHDGGTDGTKTNGNPATGGGGYAGDSGGNWTLEYSAAGGGSGSSGTYGGGGGAAYAKIIGWGGGFSRTLTPLQNGGNGMVQIRY
jgi:hypothetical protein